MPEAAFDCALHAFGHSLLELAAGAAFRARSVPLASLVSRVGSDRRAVSRNFSGDVDDEFAAVGAC